MWNLGQIREKKEDILSIYAQLDLEFKNCFLHICDTYNWFRFYRLDFQLNTDFPFQFCIF